MSRIIKLYGPRDLRYESYNPPALGSHDVLVRSLIGAISSGTESAWYFGTDPQMDPGFQPVRFEHAGFPRMLGYEKVAKIIAMGASVQGLHAGQRVIARFGHGEEYVVPASKVTPVPDDITNEQAILSVLMRVTTHGIRRSRLSLGEDVMITGAGPLGLLTVIAARQAGASRIIVSDLYEKKLNIARQFGADETYNPDDGPVAERIMDAHGPGCIDVAFECTSSYKALADATMVLRRNGRVCVISQLKGAYPEYPVFGMDFHLGELEMISSDGGWDAIKHARWYFNAIRRGVITQIESMITHRIHFNEVEKGFDLLEHHPDEVVKIIVDY